MGHFQPRQPRLARGLMSAVGLIAAVRSTDAGSSVSAIRRPEQVQQKLFDHLVGAGEKRWRHFKAKCLGRLQVNHELEGGRP
jgi:hypothetical protein